MEIRDGEKKVYQVWKIKMYKIKIIKFINLNQLISLTHLK